MKDFTRGIAGLLLATLVCGSIILGASIFTFFKDLIGYNDGTSYTAGYNYDNKSDYLTDHEETVLNRMNTGFALVIGSCFGLGFVNGKKDTSSDTNNSSTYHSQPYNQSYNQPAPRPEHPEDNTTYCMSCGGKNLKGDTFCKHCGTRID